MYRAFLLRVFSVLWLHIFIFIKIIWKLWSDSSVIWAKLGCGGLNLYAPGYLLPQPFHPLPPSTCLHASGLFAAYRAAAYAGTLVCHRWNGCGWQAQEGSRRQVLSMPGWLMAQQICWAFEKGWEQGASFAPQLHGPTLLLGAPACSHISYHVSLAPTC